MNARRLVPLVLCTALIIGASAHAQVPREWNRKITAISITPQSLGDSFFDIHIPVEVFASNPGGILDLSTTVQVDVNGTTLANQTWNIEVSDPTFECATTCGANCGAMYVDGVLNTMHCHENGPTDCDCGHWIVAEFPGVPLMPSDEIMVILMPAPGALPDDDTSDDILTHTFAGEPVGWNRKLAGIGLKPSPTTDSFFDVFTHVDLRARGTTADLMLSTTAELRVNGVPTGLPVTWSIQLDGPTGDCESACGLSCGSLYVDGVLNSMTCHLDGPGDCDCGYWLMANFPGVELQPGDEIMVILYPAPGALPDTDESDDLMLHTFTGSPVGWSREIHSVSPVPASAGDNFFDVFVTADLGGSGAAASLDLSSELELMVNGTPLGGLQAWSILLNGPAADCESSCGSNCGPLYIDGALNSMTCRMDGPDDCVCGYWLVGEFPGVPMQTGDEIMVLLRPAPGAAPDSDGNQQGDVLVQMFDGSPAGWNRSIDSVQLVEDPTNGLFDVIVDGSVAMARIGSFHDVSFEVNVEVDGTVVAMQIMTMEYSPNLVMTICQEDCLGGDCGFFLTNDQMLIPAQCLPWPGFDGCSCGTGWNLIFPAIPIPPTVPMKVFLRPAPGALPELPSLEEDDEREPDPATGVGDQPQPADGHMLQQNHPNPFNPMTTISFRTTTTGPVVLEIFDTRGTMVRQLLDETLEAGPHSVQWNGRNAQGVTVASGHYFYRLHAAGRSETLKMTLLK